MKDLRHRILSILLISSFVILSGLECHWSGHDDDDDPGSGSSSGGGGTVVVENLSTRTFATVDTIDATTMDVETDDEVMLTCDLPTGVVLVVGDRVEITVNFESDESMWVITTTEFFQKI